MKKLLMLVVAGTFSLASAAHACDGMKNAAGKASKGATVAKKEAPAKKGEAKPKS